MGWDQKMERMQVEVDHYNQVIEVIEEVFHYLHRQPDRTTEMHLMARVAQALHDMYLRRDTRHLEESDEEI